MDLFCHVHLSIPPQKKKKMTELEQWTVVLPNFHLHAQITILNEFFGLFRQSFAKKENHSLNIHILRIRSHMKVENMDI